MPLIYTRFSDNIIEYTLEHIKKLVYTTEARQKTARHNIYCVAPSQYAAMQLKHALEKAAIPPSASLSAKTQNYRSTAREMPIIMTDKNGQAGIKLQIIASSDLIGTRHLNSFLNIAQDCPELKPVLNEQEEKILVYKTIDNVLHRDYGARLAQQSHFPPNISPWAQHKIARLTAQHKANAAGSNRQDSINELRSTMWVALYDFYNLDLDISEIKDLASEQLEFQLLLSIIHDLEQELKKQNKQLIAIFWRNLSRYLQKNPHNINKYAATPTQGESHSFHPVSRNHYVILMPQQANMNLQTVWQNMALAPNCTLIIHGQYETATPPEQLPRAKAQNFSGGRLAYDWTYSHRQFIKKVKKLENSQEIVVINPDITEDLLKNTTRHDNKTPTIEQGLLALFNPALPLTHNDALAITTQCPTERNDQNSATASNNNGKATKPQALAQLSIEAWHDSNDELNACLNSIGQNIAEARRELKISIIVNDRKTAAICQGKLTLLQRYDPRFATTSLHNFFKLNYLQCADLAFFYDIVAIIIKQKLKISEIMGILQHNYSVLTREHRHILDLVWSEILQNYPSLRYETSYDLLRLIYEITQENADKYAEIAKIIASIYELRQLAMESGCFFANNQLTYCLQLHVRLHTILLYVNSMEDAQQAEKTQKIADLPRTSTDYDAKESFFAEFLHFLHTALYNYHSTDANNQVYSPYLTILQNFITMSALHRGELNGTNSEQFSQKISENKVEPLTNDAESTAITANPTGNQEILRHSITLLELTDAKYSSPDFCYILGANDANLSHNLDGSKRIIHRIIQNNSVIKHNFDERFANSIIICDIIALMLSAQYKPVKFTFTQYDTLGTKCLPSRWIALCTAHLSIPIQQYKHSDIRPYAAHSTAYTINSYYPQNNDSGAAKLFPNPGITLKHGAEPKQPSSRACASRRPGVHIPLAHRPRNFTISALQDLLHNPNYYFYRHILKLQPFFQDFLYIDLNKELYRLFGLSTHQGLARTQQALANSVLISTIAPADHLSLQQAVTAECLEEMQAALGKHCENLAPALHCLWRSRWENIVRYCLELNTQYYSEFRDGLDVGKIDELLNLPASLALEKFGLTLLAEVRGTVEFSLYDQFTMKNTQEKIKISGVFDRIDLVFQDKKRKIRLIEYKTGYLPSGVALQNGEAVQLPLLAYILACGKLQNDLGSKLEEFRLDASENNAAPEYLYCRIDGRPQQNLEKKIKIDLKEVKDNIERFIRTFFHKSSHYINSGEWADSRYLQLSREKDFW